MALARFKLFATFSVFILLVGCSGHKLTESVELATTGSKASAELLSAATKLDESFSTFQKNDVFMNKLQSSGSVNPAEGASKESGESNVNTCYIASKGTNITWNSSPKSSDVMKIQSALRARIEVAEALGKAYSALNALGSYGAEAAVSQSVVNLAAATNTLRTALGIMPLPSSVGSISGSAAGAFSQYVQVSDLKTASAQIRVALISYKETVEAGRSSVTSAMRVTIARTYNLRIALWKRGYLDANSYLASVAGKSDLAAPPATVVRFTAQDENLCNSVTAVLESERDATKSKVAEEYDTYIKIISAMIDAHEKFEADAPLNSVQIAALLDRINLLLKDVKPGN
ncbi:hypothetical protein DFO45_3238 [Azorhizobium sp. AG788]|uniref:hypothetical protein n=1 Tax=Azorhizobium sp. AG788 TaxID=2183897 RepID=UPI00105F3AAF|nr:hypothetical protein [Azorhizobium sp. AG788]TDT92488.1 hypothetical protein DFO45_3238 [Azorhizobium sp. AG788]